MSPRYLRPVQLPAELALTPNASGDPHSYTLARELCHKLLNEVPRAAQSMTDRVKHLILSKPAGSVNEEDIASALFISKRTLARRLQREGSAYREIREQLFAELAARHLRDTDLTVEAIAMLLGYHDTANFRRAFRRWYQLSPNEFRLSTHSGAILCGHRPQLAENQRDLAILAAQIPNSDLFESLRVRGGLHLRDRFGLKGAKGSN